MPQSKHRGFIPVLCFEAFAIMQSFACCSSHKDLKDNQGFLAICQ